MAKLKKIKNKGVLEKVLSREGPLIAMEGSYAGHVKANQKFFGFRFPEILYVFRNGTVESYRDTKYLNEKLPFLVSKWAKKNVLKIKKAGKLQYRGLVFADKILAKKKINPSDALILLKKMMPVFSNGFPGIIVGYWIPVWQENNKEAELFDNRTYNLAVFIREKNEKFYDHSVEAINHLLNIIGKSNGLDKNILNFITLEELEKIIKTGKISNEKEIIERKKKGISYSQGKILYKKDIKPFLKRTGLIIKNEPKQKSTNEITGTIANKGKAKGYVKVIFNREDLNKIKQGDVLVAPMTTPWYLPSIKKSIAIVTDEGGVTCHAAIAAREMKKPCIIGTKIATKVLKDGMLVEVDANNGIVKIIK